MAMGREQGGSGRLWRTIALVPAQGRYRVRSGNIIHRLLGMSAVIIVE